MKCEANCQWKEYCDRNTYGWQFFGGRCYKRFDTAKKNLDAQSECKANNAYLLNLCNELERDWNYRTFTKDKTSVWLGTFSTSRQWTFAHCGNMSIPQVWWKSGEPSGDGACVELLGTDNGKLNDLDCNNQQRAFVCKR